MATQPPTSVAMRFGPFEWDPEGAELRRGGVCVRIQKRQLQLLAVLLERPGRAVTRQELQNRLWPGNTFVDFEDGLNTAIKKLREALGDEKEHPQYIETVPRHGYRFIAKVEFRSISNGAAIQRMGLVASVPGTADETPSHPSITPSDSWFSAVPAATSDEIAIPRRRARDRIRWQIRSVSGGAIAAAALLLWWFMPLPPPQVTHIEHLTTTARIDTPVRLVSDGARLYYMERDGDHWNLMETAASGGEGQRVETRATSALAMDVSPDFSKLLIGIFEVRGEPSHLWTIPSQGGAPMRLGDVIANSAIFSPDGKQIAYLKGSDIWVMDANGSNARLLAALPGAPFWPAWSPDGQSLRFTRNLNGDETSISEISSDGTNLHELLPNWKHPGSACCGSWTSDGRYFIFTSSRGGLSNLWALREKGSWWRRSPRGPFQLTSGPDSPWGSTPSRDGRHIFFYNGAWREDLNRLDLSTGQFSNLGPKSDIMHVSFSRDGNWIVYIDPEHGGLYRSRVDGTDCIQVAGPGENVSFPRWSPDGKWILFDGLTASHMSMTYLISAVGGKPEQLLESQTELRDADWSGDGRKIVLARALGPKDSDGRELQIVDFATRKTETVPDSKNLAMSRWSYDGRFIAATQDDQKQLKLWDVAERKWRSIASGRALGISVWSPDSRYLYFQDLLGKDEELWRYNVRLERVEPVVEFSEILKSGVGRCALIGMTPDGSPVIAFNRGTYDLFTATVTLP